MIILREIPGNINQITGKQNAYKVRNPEYDFQDTKLEIGDSVVFIKNGSTADPDQDKGEWLFGSESLRIGTVVGFDYGGPYKRATIKILDPISQKINIREPFGVMKI